MNCLVYFAIAVALSWPGPALAADANRLPPDVESFLQRQQHSATCQLNQAKGSNVQEVLQNFKAILASEGCADLQRERGALAERYKDNKEVMNALTPKIGFVGTYTTGQDPIDPLL